MELVDVVDSKSTAGNSVPVRVRPPAPNQYNPNLFPIGNGFGLFVFFDRTKQGVLYLSMIQDLYDNSIVTYKTGTQQTVNPVLDTIRLSASS